MRLTRIRFTVRRLMIAVAICALALWIAPICHQYWWTWTVVRDVKRGTRRASPEGFRAAGPASVRALRETVKNGQKKARIAAIQTLGDIAQSPAAAHRDLAKPAVPELIEALRDKDDDVRIWAAIALGQIGPDAVNAVQPLLSLLRTEENPQAICGAIQSLGEIGPGAESALPVLAAIAQDPKHTAQVFAAQALWRIGSKGQAVAASVVPRLIDQFATSKDARVRAWVAEILCEIGPDAQGAVPVLRTAAADPDVQVRRAVGNALRAITGVDTESQSGEQRPTRNP